MLCKYVSALQIHLRERFQQNIPLLTSFAVFDPTLLPNQESEDFKDYGKVKIEQIADHYMPEQKERLSAEFQLFKYHMTASNIPITTKLTDDTPTTHILKNILRMDGLFPLLSKVAEAVLSLALSNAWPERGASALKRIKTRLRSRYAPPLFVLIQKRLNTEI